MAGQAPKKRFHEQIAEQLIKQLEAGTAPWLKPWKPGEEAMPFNGISEKRYRGANSLWLAMQGRSDPRWMTYKQAQGVGAQVKKGEKGTLVQYWQFQEERPKLDAAGKPVLGKDGKPEKVTYELERPRVFNAVVFNGEQIDGLKPLPPRQKEPDWKVQERAENVLQASGANIRNVHGDRAYYNSRSDQITLPEKSQFDAPDKYYATALHELGHWTGHESRLNRDLANPFGSEAYAKEELRAEIASLMIGNEIGVGHDPGQHAAYVGSWIKALKEDPLEIVRAASDAEKIMGLVMSYDRQQEQTHERTNEQEQSNAKENDADLRASRIAQDTSKDRENLVAAEHEYQRSQENLTRFDTMTTTVKGEWGLCLVELDQNRDPTNIVPFSERDLPQNKPLFDDYEAAKMEANRATQALEIAQENFRVGVLQASDKLESQEMRDGPSMTLDTAEKQIEDMMQAAAQTSPERTYIDVPFREKDEAKSLGAKWDKQEKSWFVPAGMDTAAFEKWVPGATTQAEEQEQEQEPDRDRHELEPDEQEAARIADYEEAHLDSLMALDAATRSAEQDTSQEDIARLQEQERAGVFEQGKGSAPTSEQAAENVVHAAETKQAAEQAHKSDKITYLAVPFTEKEQAKQAGAKWNKEEKVWYAPPATELSKLAQWLPGNSPVADSPAISARDEFKEALKNLGCLPDNDPKERHPIMDGKHHRIPVDGDKSGERSGFYFVHSDGRPAGFIQNHKTGETLNWKSQGTRVNKEQLAAARAEAAQKQADREKERQQTQEHTAAKVTSQFARLEAITAPTPYMQTKGISLASASGLKAGQKNETIIPAQDIQGKHWTSQYIQEDGTKRFAKDSRKDGCFHPVGGMKSLEKAACIVICEGFATGASIKQAIPQAGVVVAFDSGNLSHVAKDIHARWPDKAKVIAGDDDAHALMTHGKNVGREKAEAAAQEIGAVSVLPVFSSSEKQWPSDVPKFTPQEWRAGTITDEQKAALASYKKLTDFNDLSEKSVLGSGAIERQVGTAVSKAITQQQKVEAVRTETKTQTQEEKRVQKRSTPERQEGRKVRRAVTR